MGGNPLGERGTHGYFVLFGCLDDYQSRGFVSVPILWLDGFVGRPTIGSFLLLVCYYVEALAEILSVDGVNPPEHPGDV